MSKNFASGINSLKPFNEETGDLNAVIETPKGSRNKYEFDEDGDPLDVLLLMDEAAFPGCLVESRLIGVIEANQTEDGKTVRNDRLLAVASKSLLYNSIKSIKDLNETLVEQIKHFFVSYNEAKGKKFEPLGEFGAIKAKKLIDQGTKLYQSKK